MVLLEIQNVSKTFSIEGGVLKRLVGSVRALCDVSFNLSAGECVALVGGSGSGKTTLAKIVAGLLDADSGTMLWQGKPLASFPRTERARHVQMIFQDPFASLNPKLSIETQLREVLRRRPTPSPTLRPEHLLESVGLSADAMGHYPFQFSGGQRQRIAIARALALSPELLIADEPLSALDVTTQAQILDLFEHLKKTLGLTFLFITHDLAVAHRFADRVVVLQDGRKVEEGTVSAVLKTPQHPYTRALLAAVPRIPC